MFHDVASTCCAFASCSGFLLSQTVSEDGVAGVGCEECVGVLNKAGLFDTITITSSRGCFVAPLLLKWDTWTQLTSLISYQITLHEVVEDGGRKVDV